MALYYLSGIGILYAAFLLARRHDRRARRMFAGRLGAIYRARSEFWRLRAWAQDARDRGDGDAAVRFVERAAALLPGITGESSALRLDYPRYAGELGWTAGVLDDELAEMGRVLAAADLRDCERWITGSGRPPLDASLSPPVTMEEDPLAARIHMVLGMVVGAAGGFVVWMGAHWNERHFALPSLALHVVAGAAVLGYVGWQMKDRLWASLFLGHRGATRIDPF